MKAAKYIVVVLSLVLLAGCVIPVEGNGPDSYRGRGEYQNQGRGSDGGGDREHGGYQQRPY